MTSPSTIVSLQASPKGSKCPFGETVEFSLEPGDCVWLQGKSGIGKSTLASVLAELPGSQKVLSKLQIQVECAWKKDIPQRERCGVLFQQTTLLDELTVAGNISVALALHKDTFATEDQLQARIKQLLDSVGMDYARDAHKRPTELSGGMGRRASLALQLAQRKRLIVLDEPFVGLDYEVAVSVAKELVHLRKNQKTALVLISHEPHLAELVMEGEGSKSVMLLPPSTPEQSESTSGSLTKPSMFGTTFQDRFLDRLMDYTLYSLPLIALAFCACGLAISMLSADLMQRLEINDQVLELVDKEVRPLIKILTGEDATMFQMMGIRMKVNSMLNQTVPPAKATLFAVGLTNLFVLEVGPLLTALLLCGRIGGSYAGKVGTMQATAQNKLLRILGVSPQWFTLIPALLAALIAGPLLTVVGTALALVLGGFVGPQYGIGDAAQFSQDLSDALWPVLRLKSFAPLWIPLGNPEDVASWWTRIPNLPWDLSVTYSSSPTWMDTFVEIATYPPVYHLMKAKVFILIIMVVAETISRMRPDLTPRSVPSVITFSVVTAGLLVILADWGFSQLWLLRH